jgi:hypothetical protein
MCEVVMNEAEQTHRDIREPMRVFLIVGTLAVPICLGVGIELMERPSPIRITVSGPPGTVVLCDVVVDGRGEEHRDTVPVTYTYVAESLRFAVIPESAGVGRIRVDVADGLGEETVDVSGVMGEIQRGEGRATLMSLGRMTDAHIASMRAARLAAAGHEDTQKTPGNGHPSSAQKQTDPNPTPTQADQ